jgi:hypothetical protein
VVHRQLGRSRRREAAVIAAERSPLSHPAFGLVAEQSPQETRGRVYGLTSTMFMLASLFSTSLGLISLPAPWIGARLWESVSPIFPFYVPLVAMVTLLPVMWVKFKLPAGGADKAVPAGIDAPAGGAPTAG